MRMNRATCLAALLAGVVAPQIVEAAVADITQTFQLQPGWNAVYLEVRPEPNDAESVFGGLPLASAWTWNPSGPKVEFIDDPTEQLVPSPQWLGYFPRPRPESILTNLFAVQANRAYLLKIEGTEPVTWSVTGVPEIQTTRWVADAFNLVGFPVDPQQAPTFGNFLAPSPSHVGQPIYRLVGGQWEEIVNPYAATIRSGEAYWVYCKGPSDYSGPVSIDLELGKGMDFGGSSTRQRVRLRNLGNTPASISLRKLSSPTPIPLSFFKFDPDTGDIAWPTLPPTISFPADQGNEVLLDLAPQRASFAATEVGEVIEIRDGFGFLRRMAVTAKTAFAPPAFALRREIEGRNRLATFDSGTYPLAGLWVGSVFIRRVSEAQTGSTTPTLVGRQFSFRVIIHVDASGTPRLLKEVIQLWKEGTRIPDPENPGMFLVDEPGRYVLLTDESLIDNFSGAVLRDGEPVGYRISAVNYDFEPQWLVMSGSFSQAGSLAVALALDSESATNPFRHKYHPDHNNRDELYTTFVEEAFPVTRSMTFTFSSTDLLERDLPTYGESDLGGAFTETISGLHRNDIVVEGLFALKRASATPSLNQ